jgi:hypothetical protein
MSYTKDFSFMLKQVIKLPEGIEFYEVDGQIVFPMGGNSPGYLVDSILYLIKRGDPTTGKGYYKYGIWLSEILKPYTDLFLNNIEGLHAEEFDPNGGDLGLEE